MRIYSNVVGARCLDATHLPALYNNIYSSTFDMGSGRFLYLKSSRPTQRDGSPLKWANEWWLVVTMAASFECINHRVVTRRVFTFNIIITHNV